MSMLLETDAGHYTKPRYWRGLADSSIRFVLVGATDPEQEFLP